jgi:thymidine phosphorylase
LALTILTTAAEIIQLKAEGGHLATDQMRWLIQTYTRGDVGDAQMADFTRAVMVQGMNRAELRAMTAAMLASGSRLHFQSLGRPSVDKHSTGGVGDKITLTAIPLVASFGVAVPQLAGRGLAHTGGTIDKLESIPHWNPELSPEQMVDALRDHNAFIASATADIVPADAKLYALRDITGTVASLPLIAASIMSKKIAGGAQSLVLDVKCGSGAFMTDLTSAKELAQTMVELGEDAGMRTRALITDMNIPLGLTIGNTLEVAEALDVLAGGGPPDVRELTLVIAREMLALAGLSDVDVEPHLVGGQAMDSWRSLIAGQGGKPDAPLAVARHSLVVRATSSGVLVEQDALAFGKASWHLGAGRTLLGERIDHAAGIRLHAKPGDDVSLGMPLFTLYFNDERRCEQAQLELADAYRVGSATDFVPRDSLVLERIQHS